MTYCEDIGLKVGDKIKFIGYGTAGRHFDCRVGDVLTLKRDDRTSSPCFSIAGGDELYFNLEYREWIKIEEENKMIKRDDIVTVEMTAEVLLFLRALMGSSSGGGISSKTFGMLGRACNNLFSDVIYLEYITDITGQVKDFNSKVDEFFTPEPSPQELKIKELEETINKAQKELQEYKALTQDK